MSVYKTLNSQDIIVSPFEVNKSFTFSGSTALSASNITRHLGTNTKYDPIYNSIKQLYYSNYISGSNGEITNAATASIGSDGILYGKAQSTLYDNYLATDLNPHRYFPTGSNATIGVISIPKELFGDYIQPNSLNVVTPSGSYIDDGEGVIWIDLGEDGRGYFGNIIYEHGMVIITDENVDDFISNSNIQVSFSSSYLLYETQYKCSITENEFNYTNNPSVTTGSDGKLYDHFTGSYFAPYITTVGLYNDNEELLAIGKLAQPLPTSRTTDVNIIINLDRL